MTERRSHSERLGIRRPQQCPEPEPEQAEAQESVEETDEKIDWRELLRDYHWQNLFNPRMWMIALMAAIGLNIPIGMASHYLFGSMVVMNVTVPLALFVVLAMTGLIPSHCSECGKAIKVGFTRCHHCGHDMTGEY
jgi:hypothetical protein